MTEALYLDHAAQAPLRPEVRAVLRELLDDGRWANPQSLHQPGRRASILLRRSREEVAALVGAQPNSVLFTSGGTEANHAALQSTPGVAEGHGALVLTTAEHASLDQPARDRERSGGPIRWVAPDPTGRVSVDAVLEALPPNPALVALHWVNNETGVIQPVEALATALAERAIPLHVDAAQAVGRIAVDLPSHPGIRSLTLSGAKIGAPLGIGALVVREGEPLLPWLRGGRQERGLRGGTVHLLGAVALGVAGRLSRSEIVTADPPANDTFEGALLARLGADHVRVHGAGAKRVGAISNLALPGCPTGPFLQHLDQRGIHASAGSACHAGSPEPSPVLRAMGIPDADSRCALRFSFPHGASEEWLVAAADRVAAAVRSYRGTNH